MGKRFLSLMFARSSVLLLCVLSCLQFSTQALAGEYPCCEDDDFGIWLSRGVGGRTFLMGGALALGGIATILAISNTSHHHHHSSSSYSLSANNGSGGGGGVNPNLNPNVGGTPATIANNTANQAANNANAIAGVGIPLDIQPIGITPINTTTTEGGATDATVQTVTTRAAAARSACNKRTCCNNKGKKRRKGSFCASSGGCNSETVNDLNIDFKIKLSNGHTGVLTLVPFVIAPDGKSVEGTPFTATTQDTIVHPAAIMISNAQTGTYQAGVRILSAQAQSPIIIHLENRFTGSEDHTMHIKGSTGNHLEDQIFNEFSFPGK